MKRGINMTIAVLALMLGGFFYVVLRKNSYIARLFPDDQTVTFLRHMLNGDGWQMISCYLPDFLWGLALTCSLCAVFAPAKAGCVYSALVGVLCGIAWEILQTFRVVSGTGDIWDVLMYVSAAASAYFINIKERRR